MNELLVKDRILISVCVITYCQENFIRQTLDNILSQKGNFDMEIVIGEDKGADGTRAICEEYQVNHPGIIRLLPSDRNYGIMPNLIRVLQACKGKYIAVCEGDDYWCDDTKLQKQLDILEQRSECSICCHASYELKDEKLSARKVRVTKEGVYSIRDLITSPFFHTSSMFFRNTIDQHFFPPWFVNVFAGDLFLSLLLSLKGDIYLLPQTMSVYRINRGSITFAWKYVNVKNNYLKHVDMFDSETGFRFTKEINFSKRKWSLMVGYLERSYWQGLGYFAKNLPFYLRHFNSYFSLRLPVKYLLPFLFK